MDPLIQTQDTSKNISHCRGRSWLPVRTEPELPAAEGVFAFWPPEGVPLPEGLLLPEELPLSEGLPEVSSPGDFSRVSNTAEVFPSV